MLREHLERWCQVAINGHLVDIIEIAFQSVEVVNRLVWDAWRCQVVLVVHRSRSIRSRSCCFSSGKAAVSDLTLRSI